MNQIQQIQRINQQELDSNATASWHDQYKDSAYINVGGLPFNLTEGDVITIFSQYGEIVDINMPRDQTTGKIRGFAWIMYYDQRSTILAVDNLNGATILGRMIRVDHTLNYKQMEQDRETGKLKERENQSFAADPRNFIQSQDSDEDSDSDLSLPAGFDPEDPMAEYIISQARDAKRNKKDKSKRIEGGGAGGESKEEKKRRKEERRRKREERELRRERKGGDRSSSKRIEDDGRNSSGRRQIDGGREEERRSSKRRSVSRSRSRSPPSSRRRGDYDRDDYDRRRGGMGRDDDDRDSRRRYHGRDDEEDGRRERGGSSRRGGGTNAFADLERAIRGR